MSRRRLSTTVGQTLCPFFANSFIRLRRLREVHNGGCIGSPRVAGSIKLLRSSKRVGSSDAFFFRPPPLLRIPPRAAASPQRLGFSGDNASRALFVQNRRHLTTSLACRSRLRSSNHDL